MKRNNALPNNHFKKTAKRIKTWFNQPANKVSRRVNRAKKAAQLGVKPTERLYPIVRCQSIRYNRKERLGKGFTPEECQAAGMNYLYARTIGVAVDTKRRNMNKEAFDQNVERLKTYASRITIHKDEHEALNAGAKQHKGVIMPLEKKQGKLEMVKAAEIANI